MTAGNQAMSICVTSPPGRSAERPSPRDASLMTGSQCTFGEWILGITPSAAGTVLR